MPTHETLRMKYSGLISIIVPRHPERGAELSRQLGVRRWSLGKMSSQAGVWIADTYGELSLWYRIISIVFWGLVLQLRFMSAVVGLSCAELMALSPSGPRQDERRAQERSQQQFGNETSNFGHAGQADADGGYAASTGLVLFGLPNVARRSEACNLARNAAAAIHNVIWRCQPCQDRASQ